MLHWAPLTLFKEDSVARYHSVARTEDWGSEIICLTENNVLHVDTITKWMGSDVL